jgi:2-iminoacetate synthase
VNKMNLNKQVVSGDFIKETTIHETLDRVQSCDPVKVHEVLAKAVEMHGLDADDVAALMAIETPDLLDSLYSAANRVKEEIYGSRLVLFAPLYVSNFCKNECLYCPFRVSNTTIQRRALTMGQIAREVQILIDQGHKRLLLVSGEAYPDVEGLDYIIKAIDTVYSVRSGRGEIRRVNVNLAPLTLDEFRRLKAADIGTYQLFQETYHRETYGQMHTGGMKKDYDWRVTVFDRAMESGINDVGIGVLFGLYNWKFELLALMQHIRHLEERFGCGPHTISVPRIEPATGTPLTLQPPWKISDQDFCKLVAITRLAVPYTGIIMTTRENKEVRRRSFSLGVSQISAGSRTNPGGYAGEVSCAEDGQFQLGDCRTLDEVVRDCAEMGYIPSFCTACYRLGRTGADFMDLAKPGEIKYHCGPNAVSCFKEYLLDYASAETRCAGEKLIQAKLGNMDDKSRKITEQLIERLSNDQRDVYV